MKSYFRTLGVQFSEDKRIYLDESPMFSPNIYCVHQDFKMLIKAVNQYQARHFMMFPEFVSTSLNGF